MVRNTTALIEQHLKQLLQRSTDGKIELQRSELAERFSCVPSQINYVISTRFTPVHGYIVESKRGGGGYVRIQQLVLSADDACFVRVMHQIGEAIDQQTGEAIVQRLVEAQWLHDTLAGVFQAAIHRDALPLPLPLRDHVRARLLKAMITAVLRDRTFGQQPFG